MHARKTGDASRSDDAVARPCQNGQKPGDPSTANAPHAIAHHSTSFMPLSSRARIEQKALEPPQGWQPKLARAELGKSLFEVAMASPLCRTRPHPSSLEMEVPDGVATDDCVTIGSSLDQSAAESLSIYRKRGIMHHDRRRTRTAQITQRLGLPARHRNRLERSHSERSRLDRPQGRRFGGPGRRFRGTRGGGKRSGHLDLGVAQCRSGGHTLLVTLVADDCRAENGPTRLRPLCEKMAAVGVRAGSPPVSFTLGVLNRCAPLASRDSAPGKVARA